jgi:hypothetical protein
MASRGATLPRWRAGRNGAAIDHQTDRRDQIEAAIRWLQARDVLFKRIAALQSKNDLLRARKNGKTKPSRVESARALTASKKNR